MAGMCKPFFGLQAIAASQPSFEVASIRPHPGEITFASGPSIHGARITGTAITLLDLITEAYGVKYDQVSGGPSWVNSDHYDIAAKAEGDVALTKEQSRPMLQSLLADRFQLKVHRETRETAVYALVIGKTGSKLTTSSADASGGNFVRVGAGVGHLEAQKGTMDWLVQQLSFSAGRPVVDRTGLGGYYAFKLDWTPANRVGDADSDTPSLFVAVQEQLGLRLESAKAPVEMIVIDRAERASGN
jgi:uncharacterized protein (TIGR03435 family)